MSGEDEAAFRDRELPDRPVRPNDWRWPGPGPFPFYPSDEIGKVLEQILERLEKIEKRLENIEKLLLQRQPAP
jgi:hypothetical protein